MHTQSTTSTLGQHRKITTCLCCFHNPERVLLSGHRHIVRAITGDLEKDAGVWSAFVSLPGRMQKARPNEKIPDPDCKPRARKSARPDDPHVELHRWPHPAPDSDQSPTSDRQTVDPRRKPQGGQAIPDRLESTLCHFCRLTRPAIAPAR